MKHLEATLLETEKKLVELAKDKKEYEAKFKNLSELELKLRAQGVDLDTRTHKYRFCTFLHELKQNNNSWKHINTTIINNNIIKSTS